MYTLLDGIINNYVTNDVIVAIPLPCLSSGMKTPVGLSAFTAQASRNITSEQFFYNRILKGGMKELLHVVGRGNSRGWGAYT